MKMTVDSPDQLFTEIKGRAAKDQRSIEDLILEFLQQGLQAAPKKSKQNKEIKVKPLFKSPFPESLQNVNFNHLHDQLVFEEELK